MSSKINFKHTSRLISAVLAVAMIVCLMLTAVMPMAAATNASVSDASNGLLHIRMVYKHDNKEYPIQGGSSFLINSTTILTCEHVIAIDDEVEDVLNFIEGGKYKPGNVLYQVMVQKDVPVYATLKKYSTQDDYAILVLNESINKSILPLGSSNDVQATDQVYALGFPAEVSDIQYTNTYTSEDVTITEGLVQKNTEYQGTKVIQHGATLTSGNSGGPLVNADGAVVGINMGAAMDAETGDKDYYYAVSIDQVKDVLDALFIEYTDASGVSPTATEEPTDAPTEEITEASTSLATEGSTEREDRPVDNTKIIIIIAIIVLVLILVAVVIIIVVNSTKKPKGPGAPSVPNTGVIPPSAPAPQAPPTPPYAQPYSRPSMPPQGAAPTMPTNEGAGETSVLNDGAGETTVLGGGAQATGFTLVKVKGGEKININKPEFTIGKERRRVDYCIGDNNSISRVHAKLRVRGGRCYITDLGSTNCTFVNGTKISPNQEVILSNGDKIKLSDEEFEFVG